MQLYKNTVNGVLVEASSSYEIFNPATEHSLGCAAISNEQEVDRAVEAAQQAQKSWAKRSHAERKALLNQVAEVLQEHSEYLAQLITQEQGKPLSGLGSRFEMQACVGWTQVPASLDLEPEVVFEDEQRKDTLHRTPLGVVAAIAPWNWPLMIAIWQIIPAIRMGNTVVLKPSEYTPIATLEMVRLMNQVLPAGVLNSVTGGGHIGSKLSSHKDVNKIMFTGSEATGRKIVIASAASLSPVTLELGGNDAAIILPNTNIKAIAENLFWGAFLNMGQTCACIKRLYVHEENYDELMVELCAIASQIKVGGGMDASVLMGPVQNKMQFDKVKTLIAEAQRSGCDVREFGDLPSQGLFIPITIVGDIQDGHSLVDQEQFGPVLPVIRYKNIEDAIAAANAVEVGLGASLWLDQAEDAEDLVMQLEAGTVWVNQHGAVHPMVPFGGSKASGYGVEFGIEGLKAVTQTRVISIKK
ncbi:MAG: aldehyde dehydrogenase family protein [Pseudomonas sp.]|nr:aldehyde dehydrogenase family protein [Pseudomonas sp.]